MAFLDRYEKIASLTQSCVRVRDRESGESFLLHSGPVNPETMRFWEQSGYFVSTTESHGRSYILTHENARVLASVGIAPEGGLGAMQGYSQPVVDNSVEATRMFRPPGGGSAPMPASMPAAPSPLPEQDAQGFAKTVRIAVPSWQNAQPSRNSPSAGSPAMPAPMPPVPVSQQMLSQPVPQATVTGATSYFNPGMYGVPAEPAVTPVAPVANARTTWPGAAAPQKKEKSSPAFIAAVVLGALFVIAVAVIVMLLMR
jgi:hypothetical protein